MEKLRIGTVELENNCILAPMAGVSDLPFRLLCYKLGAGMTCTEMVSAKAIYFENKKTEALMDIHPDEGKVSLQIFGSDPFIMGQIAKRIEERPFAILDINMGCPVPKIVNNKEGSYLMKTPILAGKIIESVARAINKPVTVKIRRGFDETNLNAVEIAHIAEESGAAAIYVHGRTREEYYGGKANWDSIREVKEAVTIPVIGNGDITSALEAKRMLRETGCDGVAIGRAARGNPWIFREVSTYLETGEIIKRPTDIEIKEMITQHAKMQLKCKGEYIGIREMRKHVSWYTAGHKNATRIRGEINKVQTFEELLLCVDENF